MSRHHSHLNTAVSVIENYDKKQPLTHTLKNFFSGQKKYGSKDRRQIRHLCYCYFRAVNIVPEAIPLSEKIIYGFFLCSAEPTAFIAAIKPEWTELESDSVSKKMEFLQLNWENLFPALSSVHVNLRNSNFVLSHFIQPQLFLRLRPGNETRVVQKLKTADVKFTSLSASTLSLTNTTQIDKILEINKEVVIQDYSSQRVSISLEKIKKMLSPALLPRVWDCCAASGGKSILATDTLQVINLTQSDIRKSILQNLKSRMRQAQIKAEKCLVLDLTQPDQIENLNQFDLIIADVPCSGSGTWNRTPERLSQFEVSEIATFSQLQKKIASNVIGKLKPGGILLYITCSVYEQENEEVVTHLTNNHKVKLIESSLIEGHEFGADSMFTALLQNG